MTMFICFYRLYKDVHVVVAKSNKNLKEFSVKMSKILNVMDKIHKYFVIESIHNNMLLVIQL